MHKNTLKLAKQVAKESKTFCVHPIETDCEQFEFFAEIMTEYVIKECCALLESGHHPHMDRFVAATMLRDHFGVKK